MTRAISAALVGLLAVLIVAPPLAAQTTEADVYVGLAIVDFDDKRYEAALANLRRALEIQPNHVEAHYYTGLTLLVLGRTGEAVTALERARALAPSDPTVAYQLGLAHFGREDYARAEPLLEQAFRADPTREGLGYYVGFMRYRNKDYTGALRAFRAGRSSDPDIQQLTRFYSGMALAVLGLPAQAQAEIDEALRLQPTSALTGPAERLRDAVVAARDREKRLFVELRFGFLYDDNVAVLPNGTSSDPIVAALRNRDTKSTGEVVGARGEYVFFRTPAWDASIGYSYFGTYYNEGDLSDFNVTDHLGSLAATHRTALAGMPAQARLEYNYDILFLENDRFVQRHTATLSGTLVESARHLTQAFGRYQRNQFNQILPSVPSSEDRDGNTWTAGLIHLLRFEEDRHFLKAGYQFDVDDTNGQDYDYVGHRLLAGGQYTLPWFGIRLKYDLDVHFRNYTHRNKLFPTNAPDTKERSDTQIINAVRAELPLPMGFTLSADYQNVINDSNLKVFDYDRNVVSLIVSWTY